MPSWLAPWLIPLALLIGVIGAAVELWVGLAVLVVFACVLLPYLRIRHLREHPPDPELRHRNFWEIF